MKKYHLYIYEESPQIYVCFSDTQLLHINKGNYCKKRKEQLWYLQIFIELVTNFLISQSLPCIRSETLDSNIFFDHKSQSLFRSYLHFQPFPVQCNPAYMFFQYHCPGTGYPFHQTGSGFHLSVLMQGSDWARYYVKRKRR